MSAVSAAAYDNTEADIVLSGEDADARRAEIDQQQGSVDPVVKMHLNMLTRDIVKYIEKAHGLTLGGEARAGARGRGGGRILCGG